ncbi:MAG: bifunctional [glutamate--ammonia ligase]-adenylyl-L-tyrosine phosphorylase/[glutamate--ammonia-ligase] adenylyltransferase [Blastomonas sp.]
MTKTDQAALTDAMRRARDNAPFLQRALDRRPELATLMEQGRLDDALAACGSGVDAEADVRERLRHEKQGLALVLAVGDLAGLLSLEQVTRQLSDFADRALDAALQAIFLERYEAPEVRGFTVITLGKHGGRELNYSSDVDPIFLYDPQTLPVRPREDAADAAQRIARKLIEIMSERTGHGYVFRMDMRLRPASEVSPLALPIEAALSHYESQALTWEQAAFIRARACAGDRALGDYFMENIRPFVWRRSLDFGTIDEIAALTRRIRDHYSEGLLLGPGYDLKRGRGGIREVEFFTQMQQLIHGGRDSALRSGATLVALESLVGAGIVPRDEADMLSAHYRLLRTIEHRLQMVEDQQTHSLPEQADALDRVARLHGLADGDALVGQLRPVVREVADIYDSLVESQSGGGDAAAPGSDGLAEEPELLEEQLLALGHDEPALLAARIAKWRGGSARALRSPAGRKAFEAVLPALAEALAGAPDRSRALNRLDDLIHSLPSTINFFRLLEARPGLLQLVANILSYAQPLADALALRGELLDGLIDASAFDMAGSVDALVREFSWEEAGDDYQARLDHVRVSVGEKRFALGAQLIEGRQDPLDVAAGYARVAEAALVRLADYAIAEFVASHGRIAGSEPVILALGRLGGGALTHASDLDLVFLFSGDIGEESDGPRPLGSTRYHNRLAQRIIAALTVPTASGALYEVDTRLRPSGTQGLLSVSTQSFIEYQRESAWTWEHMALCRARPVYGSSTARADLQGRIEAFLGSGHDPSKILADALKMRGDMAEHKPPLGPMDAKLLPGGLVDLEFIVHARQLISGKGLSPNLGEAVQGLVADGQLGEDMAMAHDLLTRLLVTMRLVAPDGAVPSSASRALVARSCGQKDWNSLIRAFAAARQCVTGEWSNVFGVPREA